MFTFAEFVAFTHRVRKWRIVHQWCVAQDRGLLPQGERTVAQTYEMFREMRQARTEIRGEAFSELDQSVDEWLKALDPTRCDYHTKLLRHLYPSSNKPKGPPGKDPGPQEPSPEPSGS